MRAATPAASTTIIVSPMAREAVISSAPTMPGRAAGRMTRLTVSERVAPRPSEPSRRARGTAVMNRLFHAYQDLALREVNE